MPVKVYCDGCRKECDEASINQEANSIWIPSDVNIDGVNYFFCSDCREGCLIRTPDGPILIGKVAEEFLAYKKDNEEKRKDKAALREKHSISSEQLRLEAEGATKHVLVSIGGRPALVKEVLRAQQAAEEGSVSLAEFRALEKALSELSETVDRLQASETAHYMVFGGSGPYLGPLDEHGYAIQEGQLIQTTVETEVETEVQTTIDDEVNPDVTAVLQEVCKHRFLELGDAVLNKVNHKFTFNYSYVRCLDCNKMANNDPDKPDEVEQYNQMIANGIIRRHISNP